MTGLHGKDLSWLIDVLGGASDKRDGIILALEKALAGCEQFALRIVNNPDGHPFDRDNAAGIVKIARTHIGALEDVRAKAADPYANDSPRVPVAPAGPELTPHPPAGKSA